MGSGRQIPPLRLLAQRGGSPIRLDGDGGFDPGEASEALLVNFWHVIPTGFGAWPQPEPGSDHRSSNFSAVEIDHPDAKPLTPEEQNLLVHFRQVLHERVVAGGLSADDVQHILKGMRNHPNASHEAVRILTEEARQLLPGNRLLTFD